MKLDHCHLDLRRRALERVPLGPLLNRLLHKLQHRLLLLLRGDVEPVLVVVADAGRVAQADGPGLGDGSARQQLEKRALAHTWVKLLIAAMSW